MLVGVTMALVMVMVMVINYVHHDLDGDDRDNDAMHGKGEVDDVDEGNRGVSFSKTYFKHCDNLILCRLCHRQQQEKNAPISLLCSSRLALPLKR